VQAERSARRPGMSATRVSGPRSGTITTGLVLVLGGHKIRHCRISNEHGTETETDTCTINS